MINYITGKVHKDNHFIVVEACGVGYEIYVPNLSIYTENEIRTVYTKHFFKEDGQFLVGFNSKEDKRVFIELLKVRGLGPKIILNMMKSTSVENIVSAINNKNYSFLKTLPSLGYKLAQTILIEFQDGFLSSTRQKDLYSDAIEALKALGFKQTQIDRALSTINDVNLTSEQVLKLALAKLKK